MNNRFGFSVFIMVLCVTVFSCAHGSKMRKLYPGMTKQEVLKTLGKPDGYQKVGEYEAFKYANKLMSGWSWDRADYNAIMKDGISGVPIGSSFGTWKRRVTPFAPVAMR